MKKVLKSFLLVMLLSVIAIGAFAALSACSKKSNRGNGLIDGTVDKWNKYDGLAFAFINEEECPDGEIDVDKVVPELNCRFGETHFMVVDFEIQADYDNDGRESVTASVRTEPASLIKTTIQETNSGNVEEVTKDDVTTLKATYKIPDKAETVRYMRLVIQFRSLKSGIGHVDISFDSSGEMAGVKTSAVKKSLVSGYTDGLLYTQNNGQYTVSGITDKEVEEIVIPTMHDGKYVTGIGYQALNDCPKFRQLVIPVTISSISYQIFNESSSLSEITVDPENENYVGESGCLFNKDKTKLLIGCKSSVIPDGVKIIGGYAFYGNGIAEITIPQTVESIGEYAFYGCVNLETLIIPDSVKSLGYSVLSNCSSLKSVSLPKDLTTIPGAAFNMCTSLAKIDIPDGVDNIMSSAFYGCSAVTEVTLPDELKTIYAGAFARCTALESIVLPFVGKDAKYEGSLDGDYFGYIFGADNYNDNAKNVPASLKSVTVKGGEIVSRSFSGCNGIETVIIPESVTDIGSYAFDGCSALKNINVPDGVTEIGEGAFRNCSSLPGFDIPSGVTTINSLTFTGCTSFKEFTVPDTVQTISQGTLQGCSGLEEITVPFVGSSTNVNVSYFGRIFGAGSYNDNSKYVPASLKKVTVTGGSIYGSAFLNCENLTEIVLHEGIKSIGSSAFKNCKMLSAINLPEITEIPSYAFSGCLSLNQFEINEIIASIGEHAFENCRELPSVEIPDGVAEIKDNTFEYCYSLQSVSLPETLKSIGSRAFYNCDELTGLVIPDRESISDLHPTNSY